MLLYELEANMRMGIQQCECHLCTEEQSSAAMPPFQLGAQAFVGCVAFSPVAGARRSRLARRGPLACVAVNEIPEETDAEQVTDCFKLQSLHNPSKHDL